MATSRTKKQTVVPPLNAREAERIMTQYALDTARVDAVNASMDEEMTKIRDKYADELKECKESLDVNFQKMQMYAETRPELFKKKKSLDTAHGVIGFRTGTPKLKTLKGYTYAVVLKLLKAKEQAKYIRVKEEIAKDLFVANRTDEKTQVLMNEVGIEVVQDDTFYIDLKKEELES